ncbi:hypothetical protein [Actinoallomurus acanthiterrae]
MELALGAGVTVDGAELTGPVGFGVVDPVGDAVGVDGVGEADVEGDGKPAGGVGVTRGGGVRSASALPPSTSVAHAAISNNAALAQCLHIMGEC